MYPYMKNMFFAILFIGGFVATVNAQLNDYK